MSEGVISIHGNDYETVALRVSRFREENPDWTIKTKVMDAGMHIIIRASIINPEGKLISTGHASEERGEGMINETSALENCETSAVGRALGFYKFPGTFVRSADEMSDAAIQQAANNIQKDFGERMAVIREILGDVVNLKDRIADEDWHAVAEIMLKFSEKELGALRLAPTKGGILTTKEVAALKSNEYTAVRKEVAALLERGDGEI